MLKIALCDDDIEELRNLTVLLDEYRLRNNADMIYTAFQSPFDLLSGMEKGCSYDIVLLDVVMPGFNGIDTAKEIRNYDKNVKIIFITSSAEFAVQSYVVGAYFYQMKPIWQDSFFTLMDKVSAELQQTNTNSLIIRCKTGIYRILIYQLICCEVSGRTLYFHLTTGEILESIGIMKEMESILLQQPCFIKFHRSYLVNMDHVKNISSQELELGNGLKIPIPRGKYSELKDTFLSYAFQEKSI